MDKNKSLREYGLSGTGFNYWTSELGVDMWRRWNEEQTELDIRRLAESGAEVLRVFPLWPDFQPLIQLRKCFGEPVSVVYAGPGCEMGNAKGSSGNPQDRQPQERRTQDRTSEITGPGYTPEYGLDPVMMERFSLLLDMAGRYGVKIIVSLITGWMSGRLFVPAALEGRNVITDPLCLKWQSRFAAGFVKALKGHPAVAAWELGNECNCMGTAASEEEAWVWTSVITSAIRLSDPERPVISGMHSILPSGVWTIQDQAELTDILTVHPYPVFTPYCNLDPFQTFRPIAHLAAENLFCEGIGGKPCFAEEIGTTDIRNSDEVTADFIRANLFSALAYGALPMLWWCGCSEESLDFPPYSWGHGERGMGLLRQDGRGKPGLLEFRKFRELMRDHNLKELPARHTDAVCVLSGSDSWGACFGAFMLSVQSGFDLTFQYFNQPLKVSDVYFVPCMEQMDQACWEALLERVHDGASMYLSSENDLGTGYRNILGVVSVNRWAEGEELAYTMQDQDGVSKTYAIKRRFSARICPEGAEVLVTDDGGNVILSSCQYGTGKILYCTVPVETDYAKRSRVAWTGEGRFHRYLYSLIRQKLIHGRGIQKQAWETGITEHWEDDGNGYAVLINYAEYPVKEMLVCTDGITIGEVISTSEYRDIAIKKREDGTAEICMSKNCGCILRLARV